MSLYIFKIIIKKSDNVTDFFYTSQTSYKQKNICLVILNNSQFVLLLVYNFKFMDEAMLCSKTNKVIETFISIC